jgi:hypothetical protein
MWSISLTPGAVEVYGALISGPITNEEMVNIAAKTLAQWPGPTSSRTYAAA